MGGVICWIGPVSASNLASAGLSADWQIITIAQEVVAPGRTGGVALKPSDFAAYAATLGSSPLDTLLKKASGNVDRVILASFSAGAGLLDPLLNASAGDPRIVGVGSFDSYYGLAIKPGYMKQAQLSKSSGVPFWLTTSSTKGGVTVHSGSESMAPFADAAGLVATSVWPQVLPRPEAVRSSGSCWWFDYEGDFTHVQHATKLAPAAIGSWTSPVVQPSGPVEPFLPPLDIAQPSSGSPIVMAGAFALGAALGYIGARWLAA